MLLQIKVKLANCQSKVQINILANELLTNPKLLSAYYKLCEQSNYDDADKAAWVVRTYFQKTKTVNITHQKKITRLLSASKNEAVLRNLSGIMADHPFDLKLENDLVNTSFKILSEHHHDVAVYANFLLGLIPFVKVYPELKEEIKLLSERNPMKDKCAFQLRVKTILSLKS